MLLGPQPSSEAETQAGQEEAKASVLGPQEARRAPCAALLPRGGETIRGGSMKIAVLFQYLIIMNLSNGTILPFF